MPYIKMVILFFLFMTPVSHAAENTLKLPDYYLGAWNATAENYIYVIKDDGTITGYFDFSKKEKYTDITYRILDVQKDYVMLFVRRVDVKDPFTGKSPADTFYEFWTLRPYEVDYSADNERLWIQIQTLASREKPANPDKKSEEWLLNFYNGRVLPSAKFGHYRLPAGSFKE